MSAPNGDPPSGKKRPLSLGSGVGIGVGPDKPSKFDLDFTLLSDG